MNPTLPLPQCYNQDTKNVAMSNYYSHLITSGTQAPLVVAM